MSALADDFKDLPPLLTPTQAAFVLNTTPKGVYTRKARGKLPGVVEDPNGHGWLVRKRELLASLVQQRPVPSPGDPKR